MDERNEECTFAPNSSLIDPCSQHPLGVLIECSYATELNRYADVVVYCLEKSAIFECASLTGILQINSIAFPSYTQANNKNENRKRI